MAISYSIVARGNPRDPNAPKKYYANRNASGSVNVRKLAQMISEISTVSEIDTLAVIEGFIKKVPELIADGYIVELGDFGSFYVTLESAGADTAEAFSPSMISKVNLRFRAGKMIKDQLKSATFQKV